MKTQKARIFTKKEHETWSQLYNNLSENRKSMAHPIFNKGLDVLNITAEKIPDLDIINQKLVRLTGWQGELVEGLEGASSFYPALAKKRFPIGNFIRDSRDINYTPAPDIFHDLYGHIPFYVDKDYADACADYCVRATKHIQDENKTRMFERFFWFTYEFGLIHTAEGRRIFGGGILSSFGESIYSLSDKPIVSEFNINEIIHQEFRIDVFQERLFILKNPKELYAANAEVEAQIIKSSKDLVAKGI